MKQFRQHLPHTPTSFLISYPRVYPVLHKTVGSKQRNKLKNCRRPFEWERVHSYWGAEWSIIFTFNTKLPPAIGNMVFNPVVVKAQKIQFDFIRDLPHAQYPLCSHSEEDQGVLILHDAKLTYTLS